MPVPVLIRPPLPLPMMPEMVVLPEPPTVSVFAPLATLPETSRLFAGAVGPRLGSLEGNGAEMVTAPWAVVSYGYCDTAMPPPHSLIVPVPESVGAPVD